ncbi:MAG: hypothetical protein ACKOD2_09555 [Ilumatobacteraceae bacterium]
MTAHALRRSWRRIVQETPMLNRVLMMLLIVCGLAAVPTSQIGGEATPVPLDLAWVTLRPTDFPEPGYVSTTRSM